MGRYSSGRGGEGMRTSNVASGRAGLKIDRGKRFRRNGDMPNAVLS